MAANKSLTLPEYQALLKRLMTSRGFDDESIAEKFMLFLEEAGEFAKAARKSTGIKTAAESRIHNLHEEAADVFALLLDLCNNLGIDLAEAFETKEQKNQSRSWE